MKFRKSSRHLLDVEVKVAGLRWQCAPAMLHQRNLKTLSLGRDKTVRADKLFEVFRTDGDQKATHGRKGQLPGSQGPSASQRSSAVSSTVGRNSLDALDSDEALGFSEDTSADPAVIQEMQKERQQQQQQQPVLTKEEAEEAAAWRVEGSSRAGFKVFRQVKEEEVQSDQKSRKRKKRSRSRRKSRKDQFPDL